MSDVTEPQWHGDTVRHGVLTVVAVSSWHRGFKVERHCIINLTLVKCYLGSTVINRIIPDNISYIPAYTLN